MLHIQGNYMLEEDRDESSFDRQAHDQKEIAEGSVFSNLHIFSIPSLALWVNSTLWRQCSLPQKLSAKWGLIIFLGFGNDFCE